MALPKAPINLMVSIDEDQLFSVLHWDKVTKDIDDVDTTITSYKIYRMKKSNLKDSEMISQIITTDIDGKIDTIYIDKTIDLTTNNYYQITSINISGESTMSEVGFDLIKLEK